MSSSVNVNDKEAYLDLVDRIISFGVHNYQGIRSPVPSVFNLKYIRKEIESYHDKKLLDYLTFGFPLGRDRSKPIISPAQDNHTSAREWPEAVSEFIKEELDQGALLGPFDEPPHTHYTWDVELSLICFLETILLMELLARNFMTILRLL